MSSSDAYLFMPRLPESFGVWFGELPTPASVRAKYGVQVGGLPSGRLPPVLINCERDGEGSLGNTDLFKTKLLKCSSRDPRACLQYQWLVHAIIALIRSWRVLS